jgi:hypothetical protein
MARKRVLSAETEAWVDRLAAALPVEDLCWRLGVNPLEEVRAGPRGREPSGPEAEVRLLRRLVLVVMSNSVMLDRLLPRGEAPGFEPLAPRVEAMRRRGQRPPRSPGPSGPDG